MSSSPKDTENKQDQRCGFVSIIGLPNVGKSTLVNALVGAKVSITSAKVQTTRTRIVGIACLDKSQVILIDTPGVFQPKKTMEKAMVSAALDSVNEGDAVVHLVDVTHRDPVKANAMILNHLPDNKPIILVLNKVDKIAKDKLFVIAAALNEAHDYAQTFMISALKNSGLDQLAKTLSETVPEGPWHYEEDQITTMPMRLLAAEITREKIFAQLHQEIPYSVLIETELWEKFDNGDIKISQSITVERDSQKGIMLGKGGARIKQIGLAARRELEEFMECTVHLKLFVKVQENWQERPESYRIMGFEDR